MRCSAVVALAAVAIASAMFLLQSEMHGYEASVLFSTYTSPGTGALLAAILIPIQVVALVVLLETWRALNVKQCE